MWKKNRDPYTIPPQNSTDLVLTKEKKQPLVLSQLSGERKKKPKKEGARF